MPVTVELTFLNLIAGAMSADFQDSVRRHINLPMSQITFNYEANRDTTVEVIMPEWLAEKEGLI